MVDVETETSLIIKLNLSWNFIELTDPEFEMTFDPRISIALRYAPSNCSD